VVLRSGEQFLGHARKSQLDLLVHCPRLALSLATFDVASLEPCPLGCGWSIKISSLAPKTYMLKFLTKEDLEKIKKELDYLKKVKRKEIAQRLKETSSMGDLTENSAYQEAKEAQGFLEGRILELENLIREAKIVEKIDGAKWVQIGSTVVLNSGNRKEKYKIVGSGQANPSKGQISIDSPLGKALLDKPEGAIVTLKTPLGETKYKIIKIE